MKKNILTIFFPFICATLQAENSVVQTVYDDAKAVKRIIQVAKRDLPKDIVKRILQEDIDLLRGKRNDSIYDYAHFERQEAGRKEDRLTVRERKKDELVRLSLSGELAYQLNVEVPGRRLLVAKNRRVYIDRIDLDYVPLGGARQSTTLPVQTWLEPGDRKRFEIPEISNNVRATVWARVDSSKGGTASVDLTLLKARLVDNADSPYFGAVQNAQLLMRAVDDENEPTMRSLTEALMNSLAPRLGKPATASVSVAAPVEERRSEGSSTRQSIPNVEIYLELQMIEDLLTGSELERREGIDRLHQLVRKMRPTAN